MKGPLNLLIKDEEEEKKDKDTKTEFLTSGSKYYSLLQMVAMVEEIVLGKERERGGSQSVMFTNKINKRSEQNRVAIGAEATALLFRNRQSPGVQPAATGTSLQQAGWRQGKGVGAGLHA